MYIYIHASLCVCKNKHVYKYVVTNIHIRVTTHPLTHPHSPKRLFHLDSFLLLEEKHVEINIKQMVQQRNTVCIIVQLTYTTCIIVQVQYSPNVTYG